MKFLDRALRMVRADAHGIMDQLEERSLLLKQHLREAELEQEAPAAPIGGQRAGAGGGEPH